MKLVIVESPSKAKTIEKYLGSDFKVVASFGHIRDLETTGSSDLGVDIENDFLPKYVVSKDKTKVIRTLQELCKKADEVYLASDPDREGEAIAWHLADVLGLDVNVTKRLEFHEVTKKAIIEAIENPRTINMDLVSSQEARRITDRIIGFRLSNLVQRKLKARSAGRVQSVALKLIVDREREIENFQSKTSYKIESTIGPKSKKLVSTLVNEKYETLKLKTKEEADAIVKALGKKAFVKEVINEEKINHSAPPLTTSSLQQESFNHYKYSAKKTMEYAQKLYEGKTIGKRHTGLITYMRTDSIRLSPQFTFAAREYIKDKFGEDYLGFVKTQKEKDNVQDAHEAIRPTDINLIPDEIKGYLSTEEYNVYKLIWIRAVCSMMAPEKVAVTKVIFDNNTHLFMIDGKVRLFDGYKKIYDEYVKPKYSAIPVYNVNEEVEVIDNKIKEDVTKPPARYSEASLVKAMEELGIGRPSTYAATIEALNRSKYVTTEKKYLKPTDISMVVNDKLQEFFESFINVKYTANMEKDLDSIALNEMNRTDYLTKTYGDFKGLYDVASIQFKKVNDDLLDEECPLCHSKLRIVHGKNGDFISCSNYPECNYIKREDQQVLEEKCPHCGSNLRVIKGKFGEFISCSNYPLCNFRKNKVTIPENARKCPDCSDGYLIIKKSQYGGFLGCTNYPNCRHMEKIPFKK